VKQEKAMSDWMEPPPENWRKATPEEIKAQRQNPFLWFVLGALAVLFLLMILGYGGGVGYGD
jgi:hypothetical protein